MDYDFRIKLAERELEHLKEMQELQRLRQDAADNRLDKMQDVVDGILRSIAELRDVQLETQVQLQSLIQALSREHGNGHRGTN